MEITSKPYAVLHYGESQFQLGMEDGMQIALKIEKAISEKEFWITVQSLNFGTIELFISPGIPMWVETC